MEQGVDANPNSPASPSLQTRAARKARRYAFACASCKARKIKCSGDQPICRGCRRNGEDCVWPAQLSAESRLRDANAQIRQLRASLRAARDNPSGLDPLAAAATGEEDAISVQTISPSYPQTAVATNPSPAADGTYPASATSLWFQVGIGEDGAVRYNGPTSRFYAGPLDGDREEDSPDNHPTSEATSRPRASELQALRSQYDLLDAVWSPLITTKANMSSTGVPTHIGMALLDIYWTWLQPLHNCVYRPCFIMDMALGGPYYSDFLLMCIFGLAARHLPEQEQTSFAGVGNGEKFIARAKELLLEELAAPKPRIPTIQGLIILGGRQCAVGKSSEGWLYTGMAIRMMVDIGLHLDITKLAKVERLTPVEAELRKRLFNSAYIWDKTISLALGRPPSLTRRPYASEEIWDAFDNQQLWKPVHAVEIGEAYTPIPCLNTATFNAFCDLHVIATDMMLLFATTPAMGQFTSQINSLADRCSQWYDRLLPSLKIGDTEQLERSPPPHIISLNLLYHVLHILLARPYVTAPDATVRSQSMKNCILHSKRIYAIHDLYTRTFPHRLMTYQVSYCIYTAATVEAQAMKFAPDSDIRSQAAFRLAAAVKVLQAEAAHTPGSGRSLNTIRHLLSAGGLDNHTAPASSPLRPGLQNSRVGTAVAEGSRTLGEANDAEHSLGSPAAQPWLYSPRPTDTDMQTRAYASGSYWDDVLHQGGIDTGAGFHPDTFPWAGDASVWMTGPSAFYNGGVVPPGWDLMPG
ncbi:hypothetical protein GQ53DRAFT_789942 [Thozetella sp. PMI_491]|nr:hypothetical protein GQ53DRAFT_789942 [Thozetella sp. PMI_491]